MCVRNFIASLSTKGHFLVRTTGLFFSQLLSPWAPLHEGRLRTKTGRPAFRHSRSVLNWTPSIAGNRPKTFPTFLIPGCRSNHKTGSAMAVPSAHLQVIWTLEVQHEDPAASKYVWFPFADATVHVINSGYDKGDVLLLLLQILEASLNSIKLLMLPQSHFTSCTKQQWTMTGGTTSLPTVKTLWFGVYFACSHDVGSVIKGIWMLFNLASA